MYQTKREWELVRKGCSISLRYGSAVRDPENGHSLPSMTVEFPAVAVCVIEITTNEPLIGYNKETECENSFSGLTHIYAGCFCGTA